MSTRKGNSGATALKFWPSNTARSGSSQIVANGGWNDGRIEKIKIKAWTFLLGAIGCAGVPMLVGDSLWVYWFLPAGLSFLISVVLFASERPREIRVPGTPARRNLRNLYSTGGTIAEKDKEENKPSAKLPMMPARPTMSRE